MESGPTDTRLLNDRELAARLGVSLGTARRWRQFRAGPKYIKLGSAVRYQLSDVEAWLNEQPTGGSPLAEVTK